MSSASTYGMISGVLTAFASFLIARDVADSSAGILIGLILGSISAPAIYQWRYDSGLKMVLAGQQILVAVDTEHNTREIGQLLQESRDSREKQGGSG